MSSAGLTAAVALTHPCGVAEPVADKLTPLVKGGVDAHLSISALNAGTTAGVESIYGMDLLRHGGIDRLFAGGRRPFKLPHDTELFAKAVFVERL